jgi:hypothetical protein
MRLERLCAGQLLQPGDAELAIVADDIVGVREFDSAALTLAPPTFRARRRGLS